MSWGTYLFWGCAIWAAIIGFVVFIPRRNPYPKHREMLANDKLCKGKTPVYEDFAAAGGTPYMPFPDTRER